MSDDKETGITRQEFNDWHRSKVTKWMVKRLTEMRNDKAEMVLAGATLAPQAGDNATPYNIGIVAGIDQFLNTKYDDDSNPVSSYEH